MNESKATRYQRLRRRATAAGVASAGIMLGLIALTPISRTLSGLAHRFATGLSGVTESAVALAAFVVLVVVLWELAMLPAMWYLVQRVDRRYAQNEPGFEDVAAAQARATGVALSGALVAGAVVLIAVAIAGRWWWLFAGLVLGGGLAGALRAAPWVLSAFADVRPLARGDLADRLTELARRARVPVGGIVEWTVDESAGATALVAGVGAGRRVLVSSELARYWNDDEIAVVVAHELAHHVYRDLWRALALDLAILSVALFVADRAVVAAAGVLGLAGPADLAALPLVAFVASSVWTLATPLRHAQSRGQERRADMFALAVTGGAEAFGAAIRRLGERRLAEERPSALTRWLYHRHPSVAERLALADAYRRARTGV